MNDLVSIIMPSYNTEKYIVESINSVLNQSYKNFELIIVDDKSTDNTVDLIKSFDDDRIILFVNENNQGAAFSRNRALKEAKGKWIAFLDSDDIWHKEKLSKQISFMEKHNYNFSYTNYYDVDVTTNKIEHLVSGPKKISKSMMFNYCWPGCLTVMYNADKVGLIQVENIRKNNDYAMWLKVCKKETCYLLNEELAYYRKGRSNSISSISKFKLIKWHYRLFRYAEKENFLLSTFNVFRNICFLFVKKFLYIKKVNTDM